MMELRAQRFFNRPFPATSRSVIGLAICAATASYAPPVFSQEAGQKLQLEEVIVTARRKEEFLQDVPISMTVFNQQQLNNANITNAADLATYTPSLYANNRFGGDSTTFQIRGFTQELRTTSSVGVYFAEVIAPRGGNTSSSGDGAGPGDLYDLENVQVLKGPQGTLFGRNTTGGAVMLTPKRPTDEFEGYVEVSAGNYDLLRGQAVVNIPVSDSVRLRLGVDSQTRDGYRNNISGIGPDAFDDVDYTSLRGSLVVDITDNLENYTILKGVNSNTNNTASSIFVCNPGGSYGSYCVGDIENREAIGGRDFYDVWSNMENPRSKLKSWQAINTTTWEMSENFTVKNILSYANLETEYETMVYGTNWQQVMDNGISQEQIFAMAGLPDGGLTSDSHTFVEELQFQGFAFNDRLSWQAGLYYEKTKPGDDYGSQNASSISCDRSTVKARDPMDWRCNDVLKARVQRVFDGLGIPVPDRLKLIGGSLSYGPGGVTYENKAVYAQGTYDLTDELSFTAGIRYTDDETEGEVKQIIAKFPGDIANGGYFAPIEILERNRNPVSESDEPTWLLGLDYKPGSDYLLYAKYARGYRQGSVNLAGTPGLDVHGPEEVDAYEIGAKTRFQSVVPGIFNISLFYNDFTDQQVQMGYLNTDGGGTTAIVNAGASTIWGAEIEAQFLLTDNLSLSASYSYLNTEVDELDLPELDPQYGDPSTVVVTTAEGEPLPYAPENQLSATLSYLLPLDTALGDINLSATYVFTDERQAVSEETSPLYLLDSYELLNLNLNWSAILGTGLDLGVFVTNVTDEEYITFMTGNWNTGLESGQIGQPRMYGMRLKYNF